MCLVEGRENQASRQEEGEMTRARGYGLLERVDMDGSRSWCRSKTRNVTKKVANFVSVIEPFYDQRKTNIKKRQGVEWGRRSEGENEA